MKLVAVTPTYGRPECLTLCKEWMRRQSRPPDKHIIVEGGHIWANLLRADVGNADAIAIVEDDDYYAPCWLEWVESQLSRVEVCGKAHGHLYHIPAAIACQREYEGACFLAATAMRAELWPRIRSIAEERVIAMDGPFWASLDGEQSTTTSERWVLSLKGMPSARYYRKKHEEDVFRGTARDSGGWWSEDPDRAILREWLDCDEAFELYRPFFKESAA